MPEAWISKRLEGINAESKILETDVDCIGGSLRPEIETLKTSKKGPINQRITLLS
jgi:hypothetical protein